MKISSINVYNNPAFSARRNGKYVGQHAKNDYSYNNKVVKTIGGIGLAVTTAIGAGVGVTSCMNTSEPTKPVETTPSSAYVETMETKPIETIIEETLAQQTQYQSNTPIITTRPQSERKAVWYEVKSGDRLADIVKDYAELDKLTPDDELVPYYNLLEADNPNKWSERDKILIGTRFRVDSIMPENIIITYPNSTQSKPYVQEQIEEEEILPTEEPQLTSEEDKVQINGNLFTFDLGTLDKKMFGDYEGLMYGKFVTLDKKIGGELVLTKHEGTNEKSDVIQELVYDKDGNITSLTDYQDNKPSKVYSYVYRIDCTEETMVDKTSKSGQIDEIKTIYDAKVDRVNSREFSVDGKTIANFDFVGGFAQIGESVWALDEGTFTCNDDVIGAKRYTGKLEGVEVGFDVLKNGFCFVSFNPKGNIESREQYDAKGNFLCVE